MVLEFIENPYLKNSASSGKGYREISKNIHKNVLKILEQDNIEDKVNNLINKVFYYNDGFNNHILAITGEDEVAILNSETGPYAIKRFISNVEAELLLRNHNASFVDLNNSNVTVTDINANYSVLGCDNIEKIKADEINNKLINVWINTVAKNRWEFNDYVNFNFNCSSYNENVDIIMHKYNFYYNTKEIDSNVTNSVLFEMLFLTFNLLGRAEKEEKEEEKEEEMVQN